MTTTTHHSIKTVLYLGLELSNRSWQIHADTLAQHRHKVLPQPSISALIREMDNTKSKLGLPADVPVVICYEAAGDGFWIYRALQAKGIECLVVDPGSIEVPRGRKRVKTDRLDCRKLCEQLIRYHAWGERNALKVVHVPPEQIEDQRRPERELDTLTAERTMHINRIRGLLKLHGITVISFARLRLDKLKDWAGRPLPTHLHGELSRELERLSLIDKQVRQLEEQREQRIRAPSTRVDLVMQKLTAVRGIGSRSAGVLSGEQFGWRDFRNRRQVGAAIGLTGTPYNSGNSSRDQGISKAGNKRVRFLAIQLAWRWLANQPHSALSCWYGKRFASGGARARRTGIVALARKLMIALWRFAIYDEIPAGAILKVAA